jgi:hypothetical protein
MSERQVYTIGLFGLTLIMLLMAQYDSSLWEQKLFEVVFQAIVITGLLNMAGAFHFAANQADQTRAENTGKAFDAIRTAQESPAPAHDPNALHSGDEVTVEKAD